MNGWVDINNNKFIYVDPYEIFREKKMKIN